MTAHLEVRGISKQFSGKHGSVLALDDINLHVESGEFVCLVGASGCGKSTLLSIIAGLQEQTAGEVLLDGEPVEGPGPDRGLVFQNYSLYPWRTVSENIAFGLELAGMDKHEIQRRVERCCWTSRSARSTPTRAASCTSSCSTSGAPPARRC